MLTAIPPLSEMWNDKTYNADYVAGNGKIMQLLFDCEGIGHRPVAPPLVEIICMDAIRYILRI